MQSCRRNVASPAAIPFRATIGPSNTAYIRAWEARSVTALYRLPRRGDELPAATGPHMVCDEPTGYRLRAGMAEPWPTGQTLRGPPSVSSPRRAVLRPFAGPFTKVLCGCKPEVSRLRDGTVGGLWERAVRTRGICSLAGAVLPWSGSLANLSSNRASNNAILTVS